MSGGEDEVNVARILSSPEETFIAKYNQRDLLIYAVGIGENDLQFTYEDHENFAAFPLYPVVIPFKGNSQDVVPFPPPATIAMPDGMPIVNPAMILHGEQSLELFEPLDPNGSELTCKTKVISFFDKGKGTLMESQTIIQNPKGKEIARLISGSFIRGLCGYQGSQGRKLPPRVQIPKDRQPDVRETYTTSPYQAQVYRLSGDYNSLHIDPSIATSVGFPRPILHGLCTMGIASRALYKHFCHGNPHAFKSIRARFSKPCFPGDTLEVCMWKMTPSQVFFQVLAKQKNGTNVIVIDGGEFIFTDIQNNTSDSINTSTNSISSSRRSKL